MAVYDDESSEIRSYMKKQSLKYPFSPVNELVYSIGKKGLKNTKKIIKQKSQGNKGGGCGHKDKNCSVGNCSGSGGGRDKNQLQHIQDSDTCPLLRHGNQPLGEYQSNRYIDNHQKYIKNKRNIIPNTISA